MFIECGDEEFAESVQLAGKPRVPVEAAELHRALKDAETGRAQREKGETLDVVIPDGADLLDLEEGEVLKLPPTPEMTDGSEHQSDPETERVRPSSRPGSQTSFGSLKDFKKLLPPPRHPRSAPLPPSVPTRSRHRPVMVEQRSSTSRYSEKGEEPGDGPLIPLATHHSDSLDENGEALLIPPASRWQETLNEIGEGSNIPPPPRSYDELDEVGGEPLIPPPTYVQRRDTVIAEYVPEVGSRASGPLDDGDLMSESERREWDEFMVEHEERKRAVEDGLAV